MKSMHFLSDEAARPNQATTKLIIQTLFVVSYFDVPWD